MNHSPEFNWGYVGSGPAQLALALLLDATGDPEIALRYHQDFKWQVIAGFPIDETWDLTDQEIHAWLVHRSGTKLQEMVDRALYDVIDLEARKARNESPFAFPSTVIVNINGEDSSGETE